MSLLDALDNAIAEVEAKKAEEKQDDPSPKEKGERVEGLQADGEEDGEGEGGGEEAHGKGNRHNVKDMAENWPPTSPENNRDADAENARPEEVKIPAESISIADLPPLNPSPPRTKGNPLSLSLSAMLANDIDAAPKRPNPLFGGPEEPARPPASIYDRLPPIHKKGYKAPKAPIGAGDEDDFDDILEKAIGSSPKKEKSGSSLSPAKGAPLDAPFRVAIIGPKSSGVQAQALLLSKSSGAPTVEAAEDESVESITGRLSEAGPSWILHGFPHRKHDAASLRVALEASGTPLSSLVVLSFSEESGISGLLSRMRYIEDDDGGTVEDADFDEDEARESISAWNDTIAAGVLDELGKVCSMIEWDADAEEVAGRIDLVIRPLLGAPSDPPPPSSPTSSPQVAAAQKASSPAAGDKAKSEGGGAVPSLRLDVIKKAVEEGLGDGGGQGEVKSEKSAKEKYDEQVLKEAEREKEMEILRTGAVATDNLQAIGEDEDEDEEDEEEISYDEQGGSDSEPEIQVGDEDGDIAVGGGGGGSKKVGDEDGDIAVGGGGGGSKKAAARGGGGAGSGKTKEEEEEEKLFARAEADWGRIKEIEVVDVSDTTPAPGQTAEGGGRLNLKTSEYFIGYEEAHNLWKGMDRSQVVGTIVTHTAPKGCFAALLVKILGRKELSTEGLVKDRELAMCIGKTGMGQGKWEGEEDEGHCHLRMLQTIYAQLTGEKDRPAPRIGRHWERLGFQGGDPSTDLRDLGMLSVLQMLYLVTKHLAQVKQVFKFASEDGTIPDAQGHGYPFALLCIAVSKLCLDAVRNGSLVHIMNRENDFFKVANKFTAGVVIEFHKHWRSNGFSVEGGDFQSAIESVGDKAMSNPDAMFKAAEGKVWKPDSDKGGAALQFTDFS